MAKSRGNGQIYRDTISRCNLYSNPYDAHMTSHPTLVRQRAEEYARSKDVIESAQRRLERGLMQKLLLKLPTGKFVVVAHLGKYVFLAIILPPYIFLYGLPKWLMTEGMPWVFNVIKKRGKSLFSSLTKPLKAALQSIQKPIFALLQATKNRIDRVRAGLNKLAQKTYEAVIYPWKMMRNKLVQPLIQAYKFIDAAIKSMDANRRKLFEMVKEQMTKKWQTMSDFAQFLRDKVKVQKQLLGSMRNPFSVAYNWIAEKMERVGRYPGRTLEKIKERVRKIRDTAIKKPTELIKRSFAGAQDFAKRVYHQISKQISEWTEPFLSIVQKKNSRRKNWNEVLKKFKREGVIEGCKHAGRMFASSCKRGAKMIAKIVAEFSTDLAQLLPIPVVTLFTPFLQIVRAIVKIPPKIYAARRGLLQKIKHFKSVFLGGLKWMNSGIKHLISKIVNVYKHLKPKVVSAFVTGASFLAWLLSMCLEALKRFAFLIRLMMAWIKVFFQYGMAQVREQAKRFAASFF